MTYIFSLILLLAFGGCQDGDGSGAANIVGTDDVPGDLSDDEHIDDGGAAADGDAKEPVEIPSGTLALFISLAMDSRNESWPTVGGSAAWDETDIGLLRYLPALGTLDLLTTTTSFSFSTSHIYPLTIGDRLFTVNTRSRKEIRQYDSRTGALLGTICELTTEDEFSGFAIVEDRVFYIDGAGDLAVQDFPCTGTATVLLNAADHTINGRSMYGIGQQLISVGFKAPDQYEIRQHNSGTGTVDDVLLILGEDEIFGANFWAGDDSLYWMKFNETSRQLAIVRYALGGTPQEIIEQTLTSDLNAGVSVDASQGRVLLNHSCYAASAII